MAELFSAQLENVQFQSVFFENRFAMLVDVEWSAWKSDRMTRLICNAGYADAAICIENIEHHPEQKLDREQTQHRASCTYPKKVHNHIVLEVTGIGKTYLTGGLDMSASRSFYSA